MNPGDIVQVYSPAEALVVDIPYADYVAQVQAGADLALDIPLFVDDHGRPVYARDLQVHSMVRVAVQNLIQADPSLAGLDRGLLYDPDAATTTVDILLDAAVASEAAGLKTGGRYVGLAEAIAAAVARTHRRTVEVDHAAEWDAATDASKLVESLGETPLTSGDTLQASMINAAHAQAERLVNHARELVERPLPDVISSLQASMHASLAEKMHLLDLVTEPSERYALKADVAALKANIHFCEALLSEGVNYDTFTAAAQRLTVEAQSGLNDETDNDGINQGETALQALSSLKSQLVDAARLRHNAKVYLYGDDGKPGLSAQAVVQRKRELSTSLGDDQVLAIDRLAARSFGIALATQLGEHGVRIKSGRDILTLCTRDALTHVLMESDLPEDPLDRARVYRQRMSDPHFREQVTTVVDGIGEALQRIAQLRGFDLSRLDFADFVAQTYVISEVDSELDQLQASFWRTFSIVLDQVFVPSGQEPVGYTPGDTVRSLYADHQQAVNSEISVQDLVAAARRQELQQMQSYFTQTLTSALDYLQVPNEQRTSYIAEHQAELGDVLLAVFELQQRANDTHLNQAALLQGLVEARFTGQPMTPMIVRCLRWCYPNRRLEIAPHAGDYDTLGPTGEPVKRNGWVEAEKLRIYYNAVVAVLQTHNIPIDGVTFMAAGDYDLEGPGYNLKPDAQPRKDALSYVASLPKYITEWDILPKNLPVTVITLKELAQQVGQEFYDTVLAYVEEQYDALFHDPNARFLGLSGRRAEQLIDQEHAHRVPFNEGWTRATSRDFTRFRVTRELAFGAVLAQIAGPRMLTLSGNDSAGFTFSKGGEIIRLMQASGRLPLTVHSTDLPVTLMLSVNDGTQSKMWQRQSTVVQ